MIQKKFMIGDKTYTLTVNRSIIKTIYKIAPELLKLNQSKKASDIEKDSGVEFGVAIMANLDILFYEMIKIAQPNIGKEKSDEILEKFESEYQDVQNELILLAVSVFQTGDQQKKPINWVE
jgi:serine/threonine protein kinase